MMPVGAGRDRRSRLQGSMRKHLRRLERVWIDWPIYFVTTCTFRRRAILTSKEVAKILTEEWRSAHDRHGWAIGRYVIMPDHVHFFCRADLDAKSLPIFMQKWKQWSSKRMARWLRLQESSGKRNSSITFCAPARATVKSGTT